jgi:hypothetical protein
LQIRGKGIYDNGPQTAEDSSEQVYGDRPVDIDLPYQDDPEFARNVAAFVVGRYESLTNQVQSITFLANKSATLMTQALTREIMDKVTVTETVTGLSSDARVHHQRRLLHSARNAVDVPVRARAGIPVHGVATRDRWVQRARLDDTSGAVR